MMDLDILTRYVCLTCDWDLSAKLSAGEVLEAEGTEGTMDFPGSGAVSAMAAHYNINLGFAGHKKFLMVLSHHDSPMSVLSIDMDAGDGQGVASELMPMTAVDVEKYIEQGRG